MLMLVGSFHSKSLDLHISVTVLRVEQGLDFSKKVTFDDDDDTDWNIIAEATKSKSSSDDSLPRNQSLSQMSQGKLGNIRKKCIFFQQNSFYADVFVMELLIFPTYLQYLPQYNV